MPNDKPGGWARWAGIALSMMVALFGIAATWGYIGRAVPKLEIEMDRMRDNVSENRICIREIQAGNQHVIRKLDEISSELKDIRHQQSRQWEQHP